MVNKWFENKNPRSEKRSNVEFYISDQNVQAHKPIIIHKEKSKFWSMIEAVGIVVLWILVMSLILTIFAGGDPTILVPLP